MLGSATKLKTARKITLSGAVSGNANFDGSGNVTITTTQANIAIIEGNTKTDGSASVNYPSGYTKDNCVVLSCMIQGKGGQSSWGTGSTFDSSNLLSGVSPSYVALGSSININIKNIVLTNDVMPTVQNVNAAFSYKIILLKIT